MIAAMLLLLLFASECYCAQTVEFKTPILFSDFFKTANKNSSSLQKAHVVQIPCKQNMKRINGRCRIIY